jgi:phosphatidylglycerol---prolipoprotein diacylglyceryl transferase
MRRILFEIPNAPLLAWIAAGIAVLYALFHALRPPRKDAEGNREPFPVSAVAGGIIAALILVLGVARNESFREDVAVLKDGRKGTVLAEREKEKNVIVMVRGGVKPLSVPRADIESVQTGVPKGIPIYSYGFMMMTAFATAIFVASYRARNAGIDPNIILDAGLWCMIAGIAGSRLFYVAQYHEQFRGRGLFDYFKVWEGGLVFYGGLIGGVVAGLLFLVRRKAPLRQVIDIVAPSVPLGVAFARFGCFLNGCCFGRRADPSYPLAVQFGADSHALQRHLDLGYVPHGAEFCAPVHPSQLYESVTCFALFAFLSLYYVLTRRRRVPGEVFLLFAVLYPAARIVLETFRQDTNPVFGTGLVMGQAVSIPILAVCLPWFVWLQVSRFRRGRAEKAPDGKAGPAQTGP